MNLISGNRETSSRLSALAYSPRKLSKRPAPSHKRARAPSKKRCASHEDIKQKAYELRAATTLARLWGEQVRRAAARDLLGPVCGWFTEGFDTADLKEAKTLLTELA
jgi:predicted ATPase